MNSSHGAREQAHLQHSTKGLSLKAAPKPLQGGPSREETPDKAPHSSGTACLAADSPQVTAVPRTPTAKALAGKRGKACRACRCALDLA